MASTFSQVRALIMGAFMGIWAAQASPGLGLVVGILVWFSLGMISEARARRRHALAAQEHAEAIEAEEELRAAVRRRLEAPQPREDWFSPN